MRKQVDPVQSAGLDGGGLTLVGAAFGGEPDTSICAHRIRSVGWLRSDRRSKAAMQ